MDAAVFLRADSNNLPKVDTFMLLEFMKNSDKHNVAEIRSVKALLSSRESYVESAVGYVEIKRAGNICHVRAKVVPEHKISSKYYVVVVELNDDTITDISCNGCAAAAGGVWSLKNLSISVPRAVLSGEGQAAVLRCSYDLEGAALYSIRWYRGETEFYRYVPRELPPSMVFPLPGASVDLTQSDHQQVRIVNLNRRLSGDYQCEVSADAPLFHTDIRWAPLTVVDPPFRAPRMTVSRDNFARGDVIRANCTVDEAYPAPNITWILDDHKIAETIPDPPPDLDFSERGASSQLELTVLEAEQYKVGLTYTSASLARSYGYEPEPRKNLTTVRYTMVSPPSGQFTLGCVTTIFDIYARKSEPVVIREDTPRPESVTREDSSGALSSLSLFAATCACALHAL